VLDSDSDDWLGYRSFIFILYWITSWTWSGPP
jgi:hypothetical protein